MPDLTITEFATWLLATAGATLILTRGEIFAGLRARVPAGFWRHGVECPMCVGFWAGVVASLAWRSPSSGIMSSFLVAARATFVDENALDARAILERHATRARRLFQKSREPTHAAVDAPHTLLFDMGDEHERCRCRKRRRTAIGGVTAEQLTQARIVKIAAELFPHDGKGRNAEEIADTRHTYAAAQRQGIGM